MQLHSKSIKQAKHHQLTSLPMAAEALETRIVPAAVFSFTEADGDLVTVTTSLGTNAQLAAAITLGGVGNQYIDDIDLTDAVFAGSDLRVASAPGGAAGDGFINVGTVNASGFDLGNVIIDGDLGRLIAGDFGLTTPGVKNVTVQSLGKFDTDTGALNLTSAILGDAGVITVKTDIRAASILVNGAAGFGGSAKALIVGGSIIGTAIMETGQIDADGNIGLLKIGGSLVGGDGDDSATIRVGGTIGVLDIKGSLVGDGLRTAKILADSIGTLRIGGSLLGGPGNESANIQLTGSLGLTVIKGSLVGGDGVESGRIEVDSAVGPILVRGDIQGGSGGFSGSLVTANGVVERFSVMGSVIGGAGAESGKAFAEGYKLLQVRGDLVGGSGANSGKIHSGAEGMMRVLIGGSIIGGSGNTTGALFTEGTMGVLRIGGDLVGGSIDGVDNLAISGYVRAANLVDGLIFGSVIAGSDFSGGTLEKSGSIRMTGNIGKLIVKGQVLGNATNAAYITAEGVSAVGVSNVAIGRLEVGGSAQYMQVLAGYDVNLNAMNGDASIGTVRVFGDFRASDLVAGIQATDAEFGNADDVVIAGSNPALVSRIAMVIIGGQVVNSTAGGDGFGIVAQEVAGLRIGGRVVALAAGSGNDVLPLGTLSDLNLRELA